MRNQATAPYIVNDHARLQFRLRDLQDEIARTRKQERELRRHRRIAKQELAQTADLLSAETDRVWALEAGAAE